MAAQKPDFLVIIDAWELSFLEDRRMPAKGFDRRKVWLVRDMARHILSRLAKESRPNAPSGLEMLL